VEGCSEDAAQHLHVGAARHDPPEVEHELSRVVKNVGEVDVVALRRRVVDGDLKRNRLGIGHGDLREKSIVIASEDGLRLSPVTRAQGRSTAFRCAIALASPFLLLLASAASSQQRVEPPDPTRPLRGNPLIADGDLHYGRRQEGRVGAKASDREISAAIASYDTAARAPDSAEARWKLARALYFKAAYTGLDEDAQKALYEKAKRAGEEAIEIIQRRAKSGDMATDPDAAPSYYWASVAWGQWALLAGKIESVKTGVADKIRLYAVTVIAIDPAFEEGGGYRVLGRLNDQVPWIPFLTGWASRDEAVKNLRLAVQQNSENFINRLFLAEALAGGSSSEKNEAIALAQKLVADGPSPAHLVEDLNTQNNARADLEKWKG
jgi:hypothetical protein